MRFSKLAFYKFNKVLYWAVPVAGLFLLSSCVGTEQDLRYLNDQIVVLNSRVSSIEGTAGDRLEGRLAAVKEEQAETGQDLDELKREVQSLSNRVEDYRALVKRAVERDTTGQETGHTRFSDLEMRIARLEVSMTRVMKKLGLEEPPMPSESPVAGRPAPLPAPEPIPAEPVKEPEVEPLKPDEDLYNKILSIYRDGKFEEAMGGFERLLAQYPESRYAENAQFWIGECHMSMKQYEQAILAFQKVITDYPKGNKVPGATYRQAVAFYEINDKISARLLLNKVIRSYPQSEEAKLAKKKLDAIK
ncbi:MAG TPA: tol-pal system protein YbgF [Desulfobacteraceae bacterium]|nr:tol-pal system protein YbgF [Desulfobacteraceae bacterium]